MLPASRLSLAALPCFALIACSVQAEADKAWLTDIDAALVKAKESKKPVMVEFTGSDWCPPCKMMHKNVFGKPEFVQKASESYVLVKIDIPNGDKALRAKNEPVLEKHGVDGVPTVILLDAAGKEFDRFTATAHPNVESFLKRLSDSLAKKDMQ